MAVRSALHAGHPLPPGRFLVIISVRDWVDSRATVWLEGLGRIENIASNSSSVVRAFVVAGTYLLSCCRLFLACQSQSYVMTDGQSASLSWSKAPIWGLRPDVYYCQTVAGLLMWGALSDKRTGLSFARVIVNSNVCCQYEQFTFYVFLNVCIYNIYRASCQSRLSTADHLSLVAPATTAV
jgi:hypothetical protein